MHSTPWLSSRADSVASLKRATPITRLPGAARLAIRASVGPILPPTPSTMRSPSIAGQVGHQRRRRRGHEVLQRLDVVEARRQRAGAHEAMPSKRSRPSASARIFASATERGSIQKPQSGWM